MNMKLILKLRKVYEFLVSCGLKARETVMSFSFLLSADEQPGQLITDSLDILWNEYRKWEEI